MKRIVIAATQSRTLRAFVAPQLPVFASGGWDVHLVSRNDWPDNSGLDVSVHAVAMTPEISPMRDAASLVEWIQLLRRLRPDVVLGGTPKAALLSMLAARATGVPARIYHCRGSRWETMSGWRRGLMLQTDRLSAAAATDVLAVSPSLAASMVENRVTKSLPTVLGAGGSKGVDRQRFTPSVEAVFPPTIGYVGRLAGEKGIATILRVFDEVRTDVPNLRLLLVGAPYEGDPLPWAVVERLRSDPAIECPGSVVDVENYYRRMNVLLFPSVREGLPNAVVEAAASGVPTVAWDVTGVRDAVLDGVTGALVPRGDISGMTRATLWALQEGQDHFSGSCRDWSDRFDSRMLADLTVSFVDSAYARSESR